MWRTTTGTGRIARLGRHHRWEPSRRLLQRLEFGSCGWIDSAGWSMSMPRSHEVDRVTAPTGGGAVPEAAVLPMHGRSGEATAPIGRTSGIAGAPGWLPPKG